MLPTLGIGLLLFVLLSYVSEWVNKIALFASVLVLNPMVKWGVYALSITLGFALLGPVDGLASGDISITAGRDVLIRLWIGNLILAALATAVSYPVVYRLATVYQYRTRDIVEAVVEEVETA